jgi:hypothetical protein
MKPWIKTIEEARQYVLDNQLVGIFGSAKNKDLPALWDAVDYPIDNPDGKGWGPRVGKVWGWKNELPQRWPDEIFYGKIKGGLAVLASMEYVRKTLYPEAHMPLADCSATARKLYNAILNEPMTTTKLRKELEMTKPPLKGKFEKALKELQITMNIARLNDPAAEGDTWVPFHEQYAGFDDL